MAVSRASAFLNSIGVDTHIPYTDGGYANIANIKADLAYLGITHVRDGISNGLYGSAPLSSFIALAKAGITFTIGVIDGSVTDNASLNARLALVQQLVAAVPGCVTSIEGANEVNNAPVSFNGVGGLDGAVAMQSALYAAVHGNPAFAGISVDYFTGYAAGSIAVGPDPSTTPGLADADTQHPYPNGGEAPAGWVDPIRAVSNEVPGHMGPLVYTETGYSSNSTVPGGVSQAVQAKYTLDLLLDTFSNGVVETDLYELMDAYATGSPQGNAGFGLFAYGNVAKPVAVALHNLHAILADTGANAASFATDSLSPVVSGLPSTGRSLLLEKSNGAFDLALWAEPTLWNAATGTEVGAPTSSVSVAFGATFDTLAVYDPLVGTAPIATASNASSIALAITDHPVIVEASGRNVAAPDTMILDLSEDAWQGDARFTVSVDGQQVGGTQMVTALRSAGVTQLFTFSGAFGAGPHSVGINFLNDASGGTATTDRNLYVNAITIDGTATAVYAAQYHGGLATYAARNGGTPTTVDTLTMTLSEDAWNGDAQFSLSVDGKQVGGAQTVTALYGSGQTQTFTFTGSFGAGTHDVAINYLNDAYGGTAATDRNLHVKSIALDGAVTDVNATQGKNGAQHYQVALPSSSAQAAAAGTLQVGSGATLILDKTAAAGAAVQLIGNNATVQFTSVSVLHGTIAGLSAGDAIDLRPVTDVAGKTSLTYSNYGSAGILTVADGIRIAHLALTGSYAPSSFHLSGDGHNGSLITYG